MIKILDLLQQPLVTPNSIVPPIGEYISIIQNFNSMITFIDEIQVSVLVIDYWLIDTNTRETYNFSETYSLKNNPRAEKLYKYLHEHVDEDKIFFETELIGMLEEVKLDWDFLAGQAHPIISERKFIYLPEPEAIPLVPLEED